MRKITLHISKAKSLLMIAALLLCAGFTQAQTKKERARINAAYFKETGGIHYLDIKASARIDRKTVSVNDIELEISKIVDEEEILIGNTVTDADGNARFYIEDFNSIKKDSAGWYHFSVDFAGNDTFKRASKSVDFRDAKIVAELVQKDSLNFIQATLVDTHLDSTLAGENLSVKVNRLFRPLKVGDDFYATDDEGSIEVQIPDGIPGVEGVLEILVVLDESDDYGTIRASLDAPIGVAFEEESTFDERTMWSPRGKTPLFLLFLTLSFIVVVWGIFVYLISNLFKIVKS